MSVLIFLAVIFVLVLVHEFGHFWTAKKTGMRVDEFGIGFPPKVTSIKRGETEYSLNLLPIGGFVRIFGEDALEAAEQEAEGPAKHPDYDRSFVSKKPWQQALVLVAGVVMNILLAWVLFITVLAMGVPTVVPESEATETARVVIADVLPGSPADQAGLTRGALLKDLSVAGETVPVTNITTFQEFTKNHEGDVLTVSFSQAGQDRTVTMTPVTGIVPTEDETPAIGVALSMIDTVALPLPAAVIGGTIETWDTLIAVTVGITTLLTDTFRLQADLSSVAGPVGIVGLVEEAAQFGISSLLLFTALISLNLAVINLLPFPALDGGRLLFVAIEVVKGSPIKPAVVMWANTIGFGLLILLMLIVTWSDIAKIL